MNYVLMYSSNWCQSLYICLLLIVHKKILFQFFYVFKTKSNIQKLFFLLGWQTEDEILFSFTIKRNKFCFWFSDLFIKKGFFLKRKNRGITWISNTWFSSYISHPDFSVLSYLCSKFYVITWILIFKHRTSNRNITWIRRKRCFYLCVAQENAKEISVFKCLNRNKTIFHRLI